MAASKGKRCKRHLVVDTLGHLTQVPIHAANVRDTIAACRVPDAARQKCPSFEAFSGDAGYRGTALNFLEKTLGLKLQVPKKRKDTFAVLPMRWVVEWTFAWLRNSRRLSKDDEILTLTAENVVRIAMLRITIAKCV